MESKGIDPPALERRPDVPSYLLEYLEAFYFLSSRRTVGFSSENPISMSDISSYLEMYPTDNRHLFVFLVGEMDSEYLQKRYGKKEGKKKSSEDDDDLTLMSGNKF